MVFFGVGFETTAPANAMAVWQAKREGLTNFSMIVSHVLVPPAMRLILNSPTNRVQGFIAPGHVCTVMGFRRIRRAGRGISRSHGGGRIRAGRPARSHPMLVAQLEEGRAEVENQYSRSVNYEGNLRGTSDSERSVRSFRPEMARDRSHRRQRLSSARRISPRSMPRGFSA